MSLEHHPLPSLLPSPDLAPFPLPSTLLPFLPYCERERESYREGEREPEREREPGAKVSYK